MVENDYTEPFISKKHLQLIELKKKLGFDKEGLLDMYKYMLQNKLKRDIKILKKQLISTIASQQVEIRFDFGEGGRERKGLGTLIV